MFEATIDTNWQFEDANEKMFNLVAAFRKKFNRKITMVGGNYTLMVCYHLEGYFCEENLNLLMKDECMQIKYSLNCLDKTNELEKPIFEERYQFIMGALKDGE